MTEVDVGVRRKIGVGKGGPQMDRDLSKKKKREIGDKGHVLSGSTAKFMTFRMEGPKRGFGRGDW